MKDKTNQDEKDRLQILYEQNTIFIKGVKNINKFGRKYLKRYENINKNLMNYLMSIENEEIISYPACWWCNLISEFVYDTSNEAEENSRLLDDDNFPIDEEDY